MEIIKLQPLTELEKRQAELNHSLVYSFLHRHKYAIEDMYNVVVFGYLKGIQVYNRREDLRKYPLAFICEQYMRAEASNYFRVENAKKRRPLETVISLDADYAELENLYNTVGGKSAEDEVLENKLIEELLENFSELQRDILKLKLEGYSNKEIYICLRIPSSTFYKEMNRIKVIVGNMAM